MADIERPTFPWLAIVVVAFAIFGVLSLVRFVVGLLFGIVTLVIVVVVAIAAVGWAMSQKAGRN